MFNKTKNRNPEKLTSFSSGAGWACKLGPEDLKKVLEGLNNQSLPKGLLGFSTNDDCAVFPLKDGSKIVQSVDFFTPIVDNPYDIIPCTPETEEICSKFVVEENGLKLDIKLDETDKSFVIVLKGRTFYNQLYGALEMAKDYKTRGKQYYYFMKTPLWFKEDQEFDVSMPGHKLILLWYNKNYVLP